MRSRTFTSISVAAVVLGAVFFAAGAFAQTSRHRAVRSAEPSSEQLIDRALANGKINAEQALTYRVFAAFGDCRLPAEFRGDDSALESTFVLDEVAAAFKTLSPAGQAMLLPYLREPYAPGGWVEAQQAACGGLTPKTTPSDITPITITILGGKVRVNYLPGDELKANRIANEVASKLYPDLTKLMGEPLPYDPTLKDPTRLTIDVVKAKLRVVTLFLFDMSLIKCPNYGPAFMVIGELAAQEDVAFGVMDAIVRGYRVATECRFPEYMWLMKATGMWAVDYEYPQSNWEHQFGEAFLAQPELPLERDAGDWDHRPYGAYLLPFYINHRFKDAEFIHSVWLVAKSKLSLESVDDALSVFGGFKEQWPEFVLRNWNQAPYDFYKKEDRLDLPASKVSAVVAAFPDRKVEVTTYGGRSLAIQPLSAQYFHYTVDDTARTLAFVNGLNYKLSIREWPVVPDFGKVFMLDNAVKPHEGLKIQALLKINGSWEKTPRDWTQRPVLVFCREFPAEHVDELVLIVSNSEYKKREPIEAEGMPPVIWVSNISCAGWETKSATFQRTVDHPLKLSWKATFRRAGDLSDLPPQPTLPPGGIGINGIVFPGTGEVTWSFDNSGGGHCTYSGSGTLPLDNPVLSTFSVTPSEGAMHRVYFGAMPTSQKIHYTERCANGSTKEFEAFVTGWGIVPPQDIKKVSEDGTTIQDEHSYFDYLGQWKWTIKAIPP